MWNAIERTSFRFEWLAWVAAAWTMAGAVAGGMLLSAIVISGRIHPEPMLVITGALATIGALLGVVHGVVLAWLGRPADDPHNDSIATHLVNLGYIGAAYVAGNAIAVWMTVAAVLARSGSIVGWLAFGGGALVAAGVLTWATLLGWRALDTAYQRWPDHRLGTWLVAGAFVLFAGVLLALRPAIPGTQLQLRPSISIWIAALGALWIATPAVFVALRLAHPDRSAVGARR